MKRKRKLTALEKRTRDLLLQGKTNQEMANDMGVELPCVKHRVRAVLKKLGLQHCRQLIPLAAEMREKEVATGNTSLSSRPITGNVP